MKTAKYFLAAILLVSAVVLVTCADPEEDYQKTRYPDREATVEPSLDAHTYTVDTDGDILPDEIEWNETDPRSWRTDDIFDIDRISTISRDDSDMFNRSYDLYKEAVRFIGEGSRFGVCEDLLDTNGNSYLDIEDDIMGPDGVFCGHFPYSTLNVRGVYSGETISHMPDEIIITASSTTASEEKCVTIEGHLTFTSYLEFMRFSIDTVSYGSNAIIGGDFYSRGDLRINGEGVVFKGNVYLERSVVGADPHDDEVFEGTVVEHFLWKLPLDLDSQLWMFEKMAYESGWVIGPGNGKICLGDSQDGGADNLLDFGHFKNLDTDHPVYESKDCFGNNAYQLPPDFNGIIFWLYDNYDRIHVKGRLGADGRGKSTTVFSPTDIYIDDDILTRTCCGHSRRGQHGNGNKVNVGLVTFGNSAQIRISDRAPNFLRVNAAIMSTQTNWYGGGGDKALKNMYNPPVIPDGPYDLDGDTEIESPNEWGIDESSYNAEDVVVLWISGSIITKLGPSAPLTGGGGYYLNGTRVYDYDADLLAYPPPFPKIPNLLRLVSFTRTNNARK